MSRRADARVRLNGRKRRRPGSLQRVLNSEVGDFSSLQSLRFNCSECSWRRVTACTDRRMTAWQVYREEERMVKWRPGQKIICRDYLTCLWNTSRLSLTYTYSPLTVKCPHYCLILHLCDLGRHNWHDCLIFSFKPGFITDGRLLLDYSFQIFSRAHVCKLLYLLMVSSHTDSFICAGVDISAPNSVQFCLRCSQRIQQQHLSWISVPVTQDNNSFHWNYFRAERVSNKTADSCSVGNFLHSLTQLRVTDFLYSGWTKPLSILCKC